MASQDYKDKKQVALAIIAELRLSKHKISDVSKRFSWFQFETSTELLKFDKSMGIPWNWRIHRRQTGRYSWDEEASFKFPILQSWKLDKLFKELTKEQDKIDKEARELLDKEKAKNILTMMGFDTKEKKDE